MASEGLVHRLVIPENENIAKNVNVVDVSNMATELDGISQFDDEQFVNVVEQINANPMDDAGKQDFLTETLYTDSFTPEGKDFITLNAADISYIQFYEIPATVPDIGSVSSMGSQEICLSPSASSPASQESNINEDDHISNAISPAEVFVERKKRRGRRPKSEIALYPPAKKEKKLKAYENISPCDDKVMERKRLNAINAKRHRDMQKQERETLKIQLDEVISERDKLKKEVEELQKRESLLMKQVDMFKKQALSLVSVFEKNQ